MSTNNKTKGRPNTSALVKQVASSFDDAYIISLKDDDIEQVKAWIPSTNEALNYIAGDPLQGAFPQGRLIEIYGPPSAAKSVLLYDAGAQCQKMGGIFILVDAENALHKGFAKHIGIDLDSMLYAALVQLEKTFDFITKSIITLRRKKFTGPILIGYDSISASIPKRILTQGYEDAKADMGIKAKFLSSALPKLHVLMATKNVTVVMVNQTRQKVGVYGNPETTTSGKAIEFYASVRIRVQKGKPIYKGNRIIGNIHDVKVTKNKVRPPFGKAEIKIFADKVGVHYGMDRWSGIIDVLLHDEILEKRTLKIFCIKGKSKITFTAKGIEKVWPKILKAIPTDVYTKREKSDGKKIKKKKKIKHHSRRS